MCDLYETPALAKAGPDCAFERVTISRGCASDDDVELAVSFCGVCHWDVHTANEDLKGIVQTRYPCVPGHEAVGTVTKIGCNVKDIALGQKVGVGCIVDACLDCDSCHSGLEQYCEKEFTFAFNSVPKHGRVATTTGYTLGGYSAAMTVPRRFLIRLPDSLPLHLSAPILCAGVSVFSPLKHWSADKGGKRVAVAGLGGLGQMGIQLAKAMGNKVTAISSSRDKEAAAKALGADAFVLATDPEAMAAAASSCDLIINTIAADHDLMTYVPLLARDGVMVCLGVTKNFQSFHAVGLMFGRKSVCGSACGSIAETEECLAFCVRHDIKPAVRIVTGDDLDHVFKTLADKNDSVVRYVLDVKNTLNAETQPNGELQNTS